MTFNKNVKNYNKAIMQSGLKSNEYINENLGLIQKYVTDYSGRTDFWTDKLNNRQLDLLSDKYLAQNANMLRGQSAFGSNSATAQQQEENAYTQQNYLANVLNQNVQAANNLQNAELNALGGATELNMKNRAEGATAASNVDAANNAWLGAIGKGLNAAGQAVSFLPGWGQVIGGAMSGVGGTLEGLATPTSQGISDSTSDAWTKFGTSLSKEMGWNATQNYGINNTGSNTSSYSLGNDSMLMNALRGATRYGN